MSKAKTEKKAYVDNRVPSTNGVNLNIDVDESLWVGCDFSEVSRRWGLEWNTLDSQMQQWAAVVFAEKRDDLTDKKSETIRLGKLEAHQKIDELLVLRNKLAAEVVVSVPSEWFTKKAHKWLAEHEGQQIDWSNADHLLDYVKELHNTDLLRGVTMARARDSKN